jgi:ADP-heptose:LPS heptosyltransferase
LPEKIHPSAMSRSLEKFHQMATNLSHGGDAPAILLFPESRRREKEWPYFAELASELAKKLPNLRIIILAKNPFKVDEKLENVRNLSAMTSINDTLSLVQGGALVISNDSAPAHMAAAVGTPVLALFGPTDPQKFGPYPVGGKSNFVLRADGGNLSALSVDAVLGASVEILSKFGTIS